MKTINSLQEFRNAVLKIAATINQDYTSVGVDVNHEGKVTFRAYIHTLSTWISGESMEECLQKLMEKIKPPIVNDIDVTIEDEPQQLTQEEAKDVSDAVNGITQNTITEFESLTTTPKN